MNYTECGTLTVKSGIMTRANSNIDFDSIVKEYSGQVYNCCYRILNDYHYAQDASQATFLLLNKKLSSFNESVSIGGWLHLTATYMSKNLLKKEVRRKQACVSNATGQEFVKDDRTQIQKPSGA